MHTLKKIIFSLLALVGLVIIVGVIVIYRLQPDYEGEKQLQNLTDGVNVYYDAYGIPHIYAENENDAFKVLGYVHAQDRLWQMELLRRIGKGAIAEVFGKEFIKTDKFFLALGIDDASVKTVAETDQNKVSIQLTKAYLEGINQFIEEGPTPVEFYLTGIEKEPFVLKDVYNTIGYMAFSFAMAHKTDPLLTKIKDKLGNAYLTDLQIDSDTSTVKLKNFDPNSLDSATGTGDLGILKSLEKLSIPLFEGSNSWVIAPEKTKNGKVILANDPHIGFSQPSVWYEAHVSTPSYEKYGYHLAGVPFPILGHDRKIAYGITMFENDDVDFYYEEGHPTDSTQYKLGEHWVDYEFVSKSIAVKDSTEVHFTFKKTANGAVLNGIADQIDGTRPVSMWWTYTQLDNKVLNALYNLTHAQNKLEFQTSLHEIHAPGLNMMYGDADGNVAWWASAQLYQIPDSINTKLIFEKNHRLPTDRDYLDFSKNPKAINPPWHYVYSANNQPDSIAGMLYPGYYLSENRAKRIVQLLEPKNDWDKQSVMEMMIDDTSPVNKEIVTDLVKVLNVTNLEDNRLEILDKLNMWEGDYSLESTEATLFHRWIYHLLKNTFHDELGDDLFEKMLSTHFHKRLIAPLVRNPKSVWWDDTSTESVIETQAEIVQAAFQDALSSLEKDLGQESSKWRWGSVHTLEHGHPMGQVEVLRTIFNVGPFPVRGSREVINNMYFGYGEANSYKVGYGPSTRRVIDFSDIENSMSILPTGQSGNPFSKYYRDQAELFVEGKFRKMMLNKEEIISTSESLLTFKPVQE